MQRATHGRGLATIGILLAAAGMATSASAQNAGDIVFSDDSNDIRWLPQGGAGTSNLILTYPGGVEEDWLTIDVGPDNTIYAANSPLTPAQPERAEVTRIDGWTTGPAVSTQLSSNVPIQRVIGMVYDPQTDNLIGVNNPGSIWNGFPQYEGIIGVNATTPGPAQFLWEEPLDSDPNPKYKAGNRIDRDVNNPGQFYVTTAEGSVNSGPGPGGSTLPAGTLQRVSVAGDLTTTVELIVDLGDTGVTGLPNALVRPAGVATVAGLNSIFVANAQFDGADGQIVRVDLDGAGDFLSATIIAQGAFFPNEMIYNPFTDKLVFANRPENVLTGSIMQMNLDGTGLETIYSDSRVQGLAVVVPTPGTLALLGLGGLAAVRRRR
jgi:hypothetical protein